MPVAIGMLIAICAGIAPYSRQARNINVRKTWDMA